MYFYNYEVKYKNRETLFTMTLRADNPQHLMERFKKMYPNGYIVNYKVKDS